MKFNPHDYQRYCIRRLIGEKHLGLFLDMGLGKTVIVLTALNDLLYNKHVINRVLIIAPKRVAESTWQDEAKKWDHLKHLRFSTVLGNRQERLDALEKDCDIYVINRENVSWLIESLKVKLEDGKEGIDWPFDVVVIDELSSFKNPKAKRFKNLKKVLPYINRLYGLTGTPASNGLMDLWAQVYLLDRGKRLGKSITAYRRKFFESYRMGYSGIQKYEPLKDSDKRIRKLISDICISIDSSDYLDVPKVVPVYNKILLSGESYEDYEKLEKESILELPSGQITALNAGALTTKLLQIASGAVYDEDGGVHFVHAEKLSMLEEIVESIGDDNVLVFYNFRHERQIILKNFKEARTLDNERDVKDWNAGKIKMLLAHPASCGYGLNLQDGGHRIVWYSPTWNLEQYQQANARLLRQGQEHTVTINHIIAKDTIDELVLEALKSKDRCQRVLLEGLQARKEEILRKIK